MQWNLTLTKKKKNESLKKLTNFINLFSDDMTLLVANVPKPGHTLHLIQPSYASSCLIKGKKEFFCPLENILFCTEDNNFQDLLNKLSNFQDLLNKLSNFQEDNIHFIVHPENLRTDEMEPIKTFISSRRNLNLKPKDGQNDDKSSSKKGKNSKKKKKKISQQQFPRAMIITALPASFQYRRK